MVNAKKVVSSNIDEVAYNPTTEELLVVFKSGDAYVYSEVSLSEWKGLEDASSHGQYLNQTIKPFKPVAKLAKKAEDAIIEFCVATESVGSSQSYEASSIQLRDHLKPGIRILELFF